MSGNLEGDGSPHPVPDPEDRAGLARRALREIARLRGRVRELEAGDHEPLAIVGAACRLPGGVRSLSGYGAMLQSSADCVREVPPSRWSLDELYDPDPSAIGQMSSRWGGFVSAAPEFDPAPFRLTPAEVRAMDPQHRLFLTLAWEALEDAGRSPSELAGEDIGVFLGIATFDYFFLFAKQPELISPFTGTGNAPNAAAGRVAYMFGLRGPALAVDTACSSSLVALHLACQSLRARECSAAVVGGVNLLCSPEFSIAFSKARMMAPDGRCKTFDARANGYVRGEGCGVIVVKRLRDALADNDKLLALVHATAVNEDGASSALTAPNGTAQRDVVRHAMARGQYRRDDVVYLEAHGTGTSLGDPIEVEALRRSYGSRAAEQRRPLGSVKTNIGHLEAGAGMASVLKVLALLGSDELAPHLHLSEINEHIPLDRAPVVVPGARTPWVGKQSSRFASVSSFGFSGINAHVVLSDALEAARYSVGQPSPDGAADVSGQQTDLLLLLSAHSASALRETARRAARHIDSSPGADIADICASWNAGRCKLEYRLAVRATSRRDLSRRLHGFAEGESSPTLRSARLRRGQTTELALLFEGDSRWPAAALGQLRDQLPVARRAIDGALDRLADLGVDPRAVLEADPADGEPEPTAVRRLIGQLAIFELLRAAGIEPACVVGERSGALAAACAAGAIRLQDGLAASLATDREARRRALARAEVRRARLVWIGAAGDPLEDRALTVEDLARQLATSVDPAELLAATRVLGCSLFVGTGPSGTLADALGRSAGATDPDLLASNATGPLVAELLDTLGALFCRGVAIDWNGLSGRRRRRVTLPAYAFERKRYWLTDGAPPDDRRRPRSGATTFLGERISSPAVHLFSSTWGPAVPAVVGDHRVGETVVAPAAAYCALAVGGARAAVGSSTAGSARPIDLCDLAFRAPLRVTGPTAVQLVLIADGDDGESFRVLSTPVGADTASLHATGAVARGRDQTSGSVETALLSASHARPSWIEVDVEAFYDALAALGLRYGPRLRRIRRLRAASDAATAEIELAEGDELERLTAAIDSCFQVVFAAVAAGDTTRLTRLYVPAAAAAIRANLVPTKTLSCRVALTRGGLSEREVMATLEAHDAAGNQLLAISGLRSVAVEASSFADTRPQLGSLYVVEHRPARRTARGASAAPQPTERQRWLIVGESRWTQPIVTAMQSRGATATALAPGADPLASSAARAGSILYVVSPPGPPVGTRGAAGDDDPPDGRGLLARSREAWEPLLSLVQSFAGRADADFSPRLWIASRGATDGTELAQAPLVGLARTISNELPELGCRLVDLPAQVEAASIEPLIDELLLGDADVPDEVKIRGDGREVPRLTPLALGTQQPQLSADGTYLLAGAGGGIGLRVAQWLATRGARHLLLWTRSRARPALRELAARLRAEGVDIDLQSVDVADREVVAAALAGGLDGRPPLRGVLHAAGLIDDGVLAGQSVERFEAVLAPKLAGAWNLHLATLDQPIELFVMFSSVASLWGTAGQANYAAANSFLDLLARHRAARQLPAVSVNWAPWADVGMAASDSARRRVERAGLSMLDPQLALAALDSIAAGQIARPQIAMLAPGWRDQLGWSDGASAATGSPSAEPTAADQSSSLRVELEQLPSGERADAMLGVVTEVAAELLDVAPDELEPDIPLLDLGVDSLVAIDLRAALQRRTSSPLAATLVYQHPTIGAIAAHLLGELQLSANSDSARQRSSQPEGLADASRTIDSTGDEPRLDELDELVQADDLDGLDEPARQTLSPEIARQQLLEELADLPEDFLDDD